MKRYLLTLMLVIGILATTASTQPVTQPTPQAWQYKIEQKCFDESRINQLGAEGWELAGYDEQERGGWHCIFKRPKN
jgi:hypothetical protein